MASSDNKPCKCQRKEDLSITRKSKELLKVDPNSNPFEHTLRINGDDKGKLPSSARATFRFPQSSVLQQVKSFLPVMAEAQKSLEQTLKSSPGDLDIENTDNCESVIEMNLAMVEQDECNSDSDSELSCSSDEEISVGQEPVTEENFRITQNTKCLLKPLIEDLTKSTE